MKTLRTLVITASALLLPALGAQAAQLNYSFSGTFSSGGDTHSEFFRTGAGGNTFYILTYGYGGGTQISGNSVAAGGFDPLLAVYDSANNFVASDDDGLDSCFSNAAAFVGGAISAGLPDSGGDVLDSCLQLTLTDTQQNYRVDLTTAFGDFDGLSGDWAFDILGVEFVVDAEPVAVPTPLSASLMLALLAGLGLRRRAMS